jgi:hypothetical protein
MAEVLKEATTTTVNILNYCPVVAGDCFRGVKAYQLTRRSFYIRMVATTIGKSYT